MTLPTKAPKAQKPWLDITIFAVVFGFLAFSLYMLLGFVRKSDATLTKSVVPVKATLPLDATYRKPSSASPAGAAGQSTEVLRLPCVAQAKGARLSSAAKQIQIHAAACDEDIKQPNAWKGVNESSGEEILVFVNPKEKVLSTSYFTLQAGVNRLVFTHKLGKSGSRTELIEISK